MIKKNKTKKIKVTVKAKNNKKATTDAVKVNLLTRKLLRLSPQ